MNEPSLCWEKEDASSHQCWNSDFEGLTLIFGTSIFQLKGRAPCAKNQTLEEWVLFYLSCHLCNDASETRPTSTARTQSGFSWCSIQELLPPQQRSYWVNDHRNRKQFSRVPPVPPTGRAWHRHCRQSRTGIQGANLSIQNRKWTTENWCSLLLQQSLA